MRRQPGESANGRNRRNDARRQSAGIPWRKRRWELLEAKMERLEQAQQINGFVSEYRKLFPQDTMPASCHSLLRWASALAESLLKEINPTGLAAVLDKYQLMDDSTKIDSWVKVTDG